jgi:hypothetical protein
MAHDALHNDIRFRHQKKVPATFVGTPLTISLMQQGSSGIYG